MEVLGDIDQVGARSLNVSVVRDLPNAKRAGNLLELTQSLERRVGGTHRRADHERGAVSRVVEHAPEAIVFFDGTRTISIWE